MELVFVILSSVSFFLNLFLFYSLYKLNKYITRLEIRLDKQEERQNNLQQSLEMALSDGLLKKNGKINKKQYI